MSFDNYEYFKLQERYISCKEVFIIIFTYCMKYKYLLFTVAMLVVTYGSYSQPVLVFNIKITTENHETEGIEMILINKHGDNNRQAVNAESTLILDANNYYNITFTQPLSRPKIGLQ